MAFEAASGLGLGGNVEILLLDPLVCERVQRFLAATAAVAPLPPLIPFGLVEDGLIDVRVAKNRWVLTGRRAARELFLYPPVGGTGHTPGYGGIGTDGTATLDSHTGLLAEVPIIAAGRKAITRRAPGEVGGNPEAILQLYIDSSEGNGSGSVIIKEVGIFTFQGGVPMWTRTTITPFTKTSSNAFILNWRWPLSVAS